MRHGHAQDDEEAGPRRFWRRRTLHGLRHSEELFGKLLKALSGPDGWQKGPGVAEVLWGELAAEAETLSEAVCRWEEAQSAFEAQGRGESATRASQRTLDAEGVLRDGPGSAGLVAAALGGKAVEIQGQCERLKLMAEEQKSRNPEVELFPGAD